MTRTLALILALAVPAAAPIAVAQPPITVTDAWVRAAPPTATMTAGYLTLHNRTGTEVVLTAVSSPQYEGVELHRSRIVDGVARMEPVESIAVPARGELVLAPGGLHLMLIGPREPAAEGDAVDLTLVFADGWQLDLAVPVRRPR